MNKLVVKDNALMNASYNLDLVEQRLILLAIIEARESGKGINANDPLIVRAESYINQFNVARQTAYQSLKDACHDLFTRQFSYQEVNERGNTEHVRSRWVSEIRYVNAEATVKLIFAPIVIPLITRLEKHFTHYEMRQISRLSTGYAIRLYEILICWRSTGKTPMIDLDEFRKKMGVLDDEYQRMHDFKKRILEPSIKQINEHTDITVTYDHHKNGRNIVGFSFQFKQRFTDKKASQKDADTPDMFTGLTDKQILFFANKLAYDDIFASQNAQVGEEYTDLEKRLIENLADPIFIQNNLEALQRVGFKNK